MKTKAENHTNYVDALENEHRYAVLTKRGRIQILVQPTAKRLRKRGKRGWCLFSTVSNGLAEISPILMATIQRAIQELENTNGCVENNGKNKAAKANHQ